MRSKQIYTAIGLVASSLLIIIFGYTWRQLNICEKYGDLQVVTNKQVYNQREPILVTVEIQRLKEAKLHLVFGFTPLIDFDITLVNERGLPVSLTDPAEERLFFGPNSRVTGYLPPNTPAYTSTFEIDSWFELSEPGRYTMTVEKRVWYEGCRDPDILNETVIFTRLP